MADLRITAVTCVKNEGPFLLEWIAFHRIIGVTDFLFYSNDCSDADQKPRVRGGAPKTSLPKFRSSRKPKPYVARKPLRTTRVCPVPAFLG